jgi:prevent-host-death family protein
MHQVALRDAPQQLSHLVDAAVRGELVLITTDNHEVIRLVAIKHVKQQRQFGSAKGLIHMRDDFDAPLDDFQEYMG